MTQLKFFLFGTPRFVQNDHEIAFRRRKALALMSYVVMKKQPQNRDKLCAMLWSNFDTDRARNNLRRELSVLKSNLGDGILKADSSQIWIDPDADLWVDVDVYLRSSREAGNKAHFSPPDKLQELEDSTQLYQDDFLAGFGLSDSPAFDEWQYFATENLRRSLSETLQTLIYWYIEQSDFIKAIEHCQRWLALDQLHEPAHRQLMQLLAWSDQHTSALRQYETCVTLLQQELDVLPETSYPTPNKSSDESTLVSDH